MKQLNESSKTIRIEAMKGSNWALAMLEAIELACSQNVKVTMIFNEKTYDIDPMAIVRFIDVNTK